MIFRNRADAGRQLAARLSHLRGSDVVVLGLPRGGVPVAAQVAKALSAPLDVIIVRKLGVPFQPEVAMGAIGEGGIRVVNDEIVRAAHVTKQEFEMVETAERAELVRRVRQFRGDHPRVSLSGRTVVVIDDGIATGSTAAAACAVVRAEGAARVVLAVPVAPRGWGRRFVGVADELVCLAEPSPFHAVGEFCVDYHQTTDEQVLDYLRASPMPAPVVGGADGDSPIGARDVVVPAGPVLLRGRLAVPENAIGTVLFAHGSGSSRHSPRNSDVASVLDASGLATLLFDLLTPAEELDRANVFDIELLAQRLVHATHWIRAQPETQMLPVCYFGASTGAVAALTASCDPEVRVSAVVSRGGRPDLAGRTRLSQVTAPTLFIVGGRDEAVLDLNRRAESFMHCESNLAVVPGATHLFEELGALQRAALLARDWFRGHLAAVTTY